MSVGVTTDQKQTNLFNRVKLIKQRPVLVHLCLTFDLVLWNWTFKRFCL